MKKRILSVLLLLAMLVTMIPFAAAAEEVSTEGTTGGQTETEQPDVGDLYEWYVKEGLTNLFTTFGDENGVDLTAGTWTAKVGTGVATLGTKARWTDGEFGGIGFNVLYGTVNSEGAYTTTSDYNNHHTDGLKLNFGIGLLPASDYTVEYLAMYKPIYVAATDGSILVKEGAKVEAYDAFKDEQLPKGWLSSNDRGVDNLGWYTSYTNRVDGVDTVYSATGRGQTFWCFDNPTWYAGNNSWKYQLQVQDDPYQTNNVIRAYSITLDETLTVTTTEETTETPVVDENGDPVLDGEGNPTYETTTETVENRTTDASFGVYRDGTLYYNKLNASTANPAGATYYYDIDTPYKANAAFALSHSRPTDFFAARIYDRALTVDEMKQNRMVDLLLYYGIELTAAQVADERLRDNLTISLADYAFETEAAAKTATETAILDAIALAESDIAFIEDYAAPEHLTAFFSVYADGSVDLAKGTWRNLMGGADATFGTNWVERDNGAFGFDMWAGYMTTTDGTATYTAGNTGVAFPTDAYIDNNDPTSSGYALNLGLSNLSTEDFTVEYQALYRPVLVADASKSTADTLVYYEQDGALLAAYDIDGNNSIPNVVTWACDVFGWFSTRTMKTDGGSGWSSSKRGTVHWMVGHPKWGGCSNYKFVGGGWGTGIYNKGGEALHMAGVNSFFTYTVSVDETVTDTGDTEALLAIYRDAELFGSNAANVNSTANAVITSDKGTAYYDYGKGYPTQTDFSGKYGDSGYGAYFYLSAGTPTDFLTVRVYDKVLTVAEQKQNIGVDKLHYYGIELSDEVLADETLYKVAIDIIAAADFVSDPVEKQAVKAEIEAEVEAYIEFAESLNYDDTMYVTEGLTSFFTAFEGEESFINTDGADKVWYNRVVGQANATFKGGNIWKLGEGGGVGKYYIHGTYTDGVFNETNASNTSVTNDYSLYFGNALLPKDDFTVEYLAFFPQIYAEVVENGEKTGALYGHYSGIYTTEGHTVDQIGWLEFNSVRPGGRFDNIDNNLRARVSMSDCTGWGAPYSDKYGFGSSTFRIDTRNTLKVDTYGVLRDETTVTEEGVVVEQQAVYTVTHNGGAQANGSRSYTTENGFVAEGGTNKDTQYFFGEDDGDFWLSKSAGATFYAVRIYDRVLTEAEQQQNRLADILYYYGIELSDRILEDEGVYAAVAAIISECDIVSDPAEKQATKVALEAKIQAYLDFIDDLNYDDTMYVTEGLTSFFTAFEGEESFINTDGADKVWYNRVVGQANATFKGGNIWKLGEGGGVGKYYIHGTYTDGVFNETNASNTSVTNDYSLYFGNALLPKDDFTVEYLAFFPQIYAEVVVNGEKTGELYGHYEAGYTAEGHAVDRIGWVEFVSVYPGGKFDSIDNNLRARVSMSDCTGWPAPYSDKYGFGTSAFRINTRNTLKVDTYGVLRDETTVTEEGVVVEQKATYTVRHNAGAQANGSRNYTTKKGFVAEGGTVKEGQYFFGEDEGGFWLSKSAGATFYAVRIYDRVLTEAEQQQNRLADILYYYGLKLDPTIAADADLTARFAAAVAGITLAIDPLEKAAAKLEISDAATALLTVESPIYNLYVEDGMTAHFSSLLPTDGSANVAAGVWKNRVAGGANATFGNADMWKKNPNGSVGYSLFYGQMDADGNFTKDSAYNTYNHTTACGTNLTLGINLLPEDDFTVEFVAMFKPIYVADSAGDIAVDAEGNLVEAADQGYDWISRKNPGDYGYEYGVVIRMGYLQAFACPHDGYWTGSSSHKRGDYMWTISGALGWNESNSTNKPLAGLSGNEDVLFTNSVVRSYAITRTEDADVDTKVTYGFVRDGATYLDWEFDCATVKPNVNGYVAADFSVAEKDAVAQKPLDAEGKPKLNKNGEEYTVAPANRFYLSERHPTDFYAVRIYDRVLTKEEQMRNHLADIALYYGLDLGDEIFTGSALGNELLSDFAEALSTATIVTNGLEKRANKAFYQSVIDNIVFEATYESPSDYSEMYVTEGLVGLFTAFTGSGTVDVFKGEWQNEAPAAAVATYGSAKLEGSWTKELLGVGYTASGSTWDDISKQLNRSISLSDDYEELENFTVEAFATVIGGTDVNGNRFVYEKRDDNDTPYAGQAHTPGRNNFRFGILTSLGFNTLSGINGIAATGSAANLGNRWAVTNIAYTGSNWTAQQAYAEAEDAEFATVYDDAGWLKMGVDLYTPAPGLMQVTKATDSNGITYNVAYNNDAPSVSFSMSSKEHGDIKDYTEKGRDYETGRRFSLFNTQAATVYAVRVYDRVLSADEMLINSFVDKAAYYQLEIDSFADFETAEKVEVANIFANLSYERDKADVQALYDFYAEGGAESLVNTLVGFDGYNPILATASGYRAVFQVNQEAYNLLTKSGYTVTYGALVAPGGNFNSLEDVTLENESVKNIVVAGEGGSGIYYKPAGARGYYYTAAVTADDPVYYSVGMIVRGYAVVTKGEESFVVYTDATLNGSNQVSILDAADYFVNAYDGDIVTQYTYMNSAVLRNILEESGYAARVSLEDDLTIYVDAENGNDDNKDVEMAGQTPETAYKTVNAAFAAAKAHFAQAGRKTVTIRLAAGTYNVTEELVLKAEDILATGYSLDVIGAGDSTILTTETEIAYDSVLTDAAGNRYVQLPAGANGLYPDFRTLYVNGKFVNHATGGSHEDTYGIEDFYILDANGNKLNPVQAYDRNQDGTIDENDYGSDGKPTNDWYLNEEGSLAAKWAVFTLPASMFDTRYLAQYAGAELHYTWDWASSMSHIDHVEQSGGSVLAYVPYGQLASGYKDTKIAGKRAWLENALVLATSSVHASEGYYYDSVSGRLYYKGLSETPKLTYASLSNMFVFENVDNISIQNMAITGVDSNYITDDIGIHLSQGGHLTTRNNEKQATSLGWVEHAAIYGKNMDNLLVSNVSVHDVAGAGVTIKGYATDIIIDSSSFENIGGSAIQIAGYKDDGTGEYIKDITITNNYVNLTGQLYRACAAIMTGNVASAKVIGNTVIGSTWSAFSFGLSWKAPKATNDQIVNGATFYCYDLEIAYNYVTDMMTCQGDGGAFYLNGGAVSIASNDTKVYNYLHHNYVVMSENSGLHGNNANGWRDTYCYYFENSTSNWLATENVLVNEVNRSYAKATFYGVYLQAYEPADSQARNVTLLDNYFIGFEKIGQVYNYHASNPNAELGQVANDYVFMYPSDLALNFFLGDDPDPEFSAPWNNATNKTLADWDAVYGVDEEGYSLVYAEEVVSSIFHAAGSDKSTVGKNVSFAYDGFDVSTYAAADRVVLKEGNVIDVTEIEGVEISTVTFTDGETSVSLKGLVGSPVKAPTYFAQPNYTYTFSVDGTVVDLADYAFPAEGSVEIDVTAVAETYTVTFVGGIVEASTEVFEGDTFEIPAEMKIAGKNPTLYYDGAELDLETFKMPAEDIRVRIEYKDARYTARFVDESGRLLKENDGRYGNRVTNPKLTKDYHTTQYLLNGVVTPIEEIVFPEGNLEITVKYVPNAYDVQFQASVITAEGATVHNYGSVNVVFGEVIDASTIDTSSVRGYKEGALLKFVAWQNFTSGVTVLDEALMKLEDGPVIYADTEWEDLPAHNATFTRDGFEDITVSVFEGSAIELPAELLKAGYNVVLTAKGEPVDLATYTMPTEDVTFAVAYEAIEYTVTITDNLGKSDTFVGTVEDTVSFATDFTKEHYTVVYKVKGEPIDLATFKVPVDGAEIVVTYEAIEYTVTITDGEKSDSFTGIFGATVTFDTVFTAPEHKTVVYKVNGEPVDLATYTVKGTETINVEYADVQYTVTITDGVQTPVTFTGAYGTAIEIDTALFTKDGFTTVYKIGEEEIDIADITTITGDVTIDVSYVENAVEPEYKLGDINGDDRVDIDDIVAVVNAASGVELDPAQFPGNTDLNGDGRVDIDDIVAVVSIASGS